MFDPGNSSRAVEFPVLFRFDQNVLARKAIVDGGLRDHYFSELVRSADVAGGMESGINRQFDRIRDAVFADPVKPYSNDQFVEAVEYLRRFARERPSSVRAQVSHLH